MAARHLSESLEDYLEAVYVISREKTAVRVKDLMNYFDYKVSSVNTAVKNLVAHGLLVHEKYGYIELTQRGLVTGRALYQKHLKIGRFFEKTLGIRADTAQHYACAIEHFIEKSALDRMSRVVDHLERHPETQQVLVNAAEKNQPADDEFKK